ncbi:MAG: DUF6152 family protein [Burkholderiales bacterium]
MALPLAFIRKIFLSLAALLAMSAGLGAPAFAHHGWVWAEDGNSELTGVIQSAKLGNPHGVLTLVVDGAQWTVEVGQPWRNERAGLKDAMLVKGVKLTVAGHKSSNPSQRVFKAERVFINGKKFDLYPDRD